MPRVRDQALGATWLVSRAGRQGIVLRRDADGGEREIGRSDRRFGLDRVGLAAAVLGDALGIEPSHRMASDLSQFLVPESRERERAMTAAELQAWLDTWAPPFETLFPIAARRRRHG